MVRFGASPLNQFAKLSEVSIPVWCDLETKPNALASFSSLVSIPVWCDLEHRFWNISSNWFKVSIPVWCDLEQLLHGVDVVVSGFQFQYGAIWSLYIEFQPLTGRGFQFQYGAIWRLFLISPIKHNNLFQFQYGAIWSDLFEIGQHRLLWFQFQYGAIWRVNFLLVTITLTAVSIPVWCDLESILERYRRWQKRVSIPVWCDLEKYCWKMQTVWQFGFNSSMVRFGATTDDPVFDERPAFQFQYGAIWSFERGAENERQTVVSIPVWCDLENFLITGYDFPDDVSIPVWCDLENFGREGCYARQFVSIPVWCDLEPFYS